MKILGILFLLAASFVVVETDTVHITSGSIGQTVGRKIIFTLSGPDPGRQPWIRSMDSLVARPLSGTEDGGQAFWSPAC